MPPRIVTSAELEGELALPAGYYARMVGVVRRHRAVTETGSQLGARALARALERANLELDDVDLLIGASATMDYVLPNRASSILAELCPRRAPGIACVDVGATCISFVVGLHHAAMLLATGGARRVAIVSAEIARYGLDASDVEPYGLFGDGAAAAIVTACPGEDSGLLDYRMRTYPAGHDHCIIRGGGNAFPPRHFAYSHELFGFRMAGRPLLRLVQDELPGFLAGCGLAPAVVCPDAGLPRRVLAEAALGELGLLPQSEAGALTAAHAGRRHGNSRSLAADRCGVAGRPLAPDLIIPHQTSALGFRLLARALGPDAPPMVDLLADTGNCIAASIPLALDHAIATGRLRRGETCTLLGSAAGLSLGALTFKY